MEHEESLVGQRLGAFQLESELGRGTMGVVYQARHIERGYPAAVKVLLDSLAPDPAFITRFRREADIIRGLQHQNIVRLYEAGQDGAYIYFAMEYFPGITAGQLAKRQEQRRLPAQRVVEIAAQAADALDYAHTQGHVIHRDIKPENLLVDRWCRVKVLDFGLARIEGLQGLTSEGTVVGSLYYVPPEQLRGRQVDGRADVYALGVSMYELLTGQRPYRGRTLTEMSEAILNAQAAPPRQLEASIPVALEAIVLRAISRDLAFRYATAGELHADLRALQAHGTAAPAFGFALADGPAAGPFTQSFVGRDTIGPLSGPRSGPRPLTAGPIRLPPGPPEGPVSRRPQG
ncbi:MAG TPA: serine/threonine-protein kinase [Ktedonobacterales bacterium]